jgi:hypothetical protein
VERHSSEASAADTVETAEPRPTGTVQGHGANRQPILVRRWVVRADHSGGAYVGYPSPDGIGPPISETELKLLRQDDEILSRVYRACGLPLGQEEEA